MSKEKIKWVCKECGNETLKLQGKCFACGKFNTLEEEKYFTGVEKKTKSSKTISQGTKKSQKLKNVEDGIIERGFSSDIGEFDKVCGGQITEGSVILLGGDPGNGKSTVLSTVTNNVSQKYPILYASGEESEAQMKKRLTTRMEINPNENYNVIFTNNIEDIENEALAIKPKLLVVDSINAIGSKDIAGDPGDIAQMKHCGSRLVTLAKENDITIIVISQVTKNGDLSGPKKVEHMVDTVLYLVGDRYNDLRFIEVRKNRFGSDKEVALFSMTRKGLVEIPDPSKYLLENRPIGESGSAIVCISDTRPLLVEVQALVSTPAYENATPRRTSEGFSRNRLNLLVAVLEKKCGSKYLTAKDIYVNVVKGMNLKEPGTDLGVAMAIYSSEKNVPIDNNVAILGEVGLAGEVRPVAKIEELVKECERAGFRECVIPKGSLELAKDAVTSLKLIPVSNLNECIKVLF